MLPATLETCTEKKKRSHFILSNHFLKLIDAAVFVCSLSINKLLSIAVQMSIYTLKVQHCSVPVTFFHILILVSSRVGMKFENHSQ